MDLSRSSGTRFLYQFNNQLRDGEQWDSSNAIATMEYLMSKGYTDVDFELGNGERYCDDLMCLFI